MPAAANSPRSVRCGFTLIEMNIVIVVLLLMAAMVVPNVIAINRSRRLHDLEAALLRAPAEAQNEARRSRRPVRLRVEEDALVVERLPAESGPEEVRRVWLREDVFVESGRLGGEVVDAGSWEWVVYPDGSSDTGGLEFVVGTARKSLALSGDGSARWVAGELPASLDDRWPAGEIEQRE